MPSDSEESATGKLEKVKRRKRNRKIEESEEEVPPLRRSARISTRRKVVDDEYDIVTGGATEPSSSSSSHVPPTMMTQTARSISQTARSLGSDNVSGDDTENVQSGSENDVDMDDVLGHFSSEEEGEEEELTEKLDEGNGMPVAVTRPGSFFEKKAHEAAALEEEDEDEDLFDEEGEEEIGKAHEAAALEKEDEDLFDEEGEEEVQDVAETESDSDVEMGENSQNETEGMEHAENSFPSSSLPSPTPPVPTRLKDDAQSDEKMMTKRNAPRDLKESAVVDNPLDSERQVVDFVCEQIVPAEQQAVECEQIVPAEQQAVLRELLGDDMASPQGETAALVSESATPARQHHLVRPDRNIQREKMLLEQFRENTWQQAENIAEWKKRAIDGMAELGRAPPSNLTDWKSVDICIEGVREPTHVEVIEAMIQRRLQAEGLSDKDKAKESKDSSSSVEAAETPHAQMKTGRGRGRGRGRGPRHLLGKVGCKDVKVQLIKFDDGADLDTIAPIKSEKEVYQEWLAKAGTKSAILSQRRAKDSAFRYANRYGNQALAYLSSLEGDPHERRKRQLAMQDNIQDGDSREAVAPDEVVITVAVCNTQGGREQEFDVLASQKLYELRDALHFASDYMWDGPMHAASACFLIDGIFYSDKRDPEALEYAKEKIEWAKATGSKHLLNADESRSMDKRFCDLPRIPFGSCCLYIRQGDVEHNVFFMHARLVHPQRDCMERRGYPVLTYMRRYVKRKCTACLQNCAVWVVLDCSLCPHNPSFWCRQCFRMFLQDENGDFLPPFDYKVFPYLHDEV